jgi:serine/threonine-protein kinase
VAGQDAVDGTPFGRYRLLRLLGRGGMGEVWRAYDTVTDRIVAIKLLPANLSADADFQQRFRREAHAAARLNSPHVVPIHDYGEIDGRLFVSMRLIEGRDLKTVLADGRLEPARAVRIIDQVAKALHAAHEVGLLHRDIKPSNILLDRDDFAYLIDFGIARAADETRMTKSGHMIGTFAYIAPERLDPDTEEDARADIYSLACVLYEALTGKPPFAGTTTAHLIAAHLNASPPRPSATLADVPARFDAVIAKGMAKNPDQRYATTVELADAARDAITVPLQPSVPSDNIAASIYGQDTQLAPTGLAPVSPPPPEVQPARKRPGWRGPRVVIPVVVAVVLLIGGGIFAAVNRQQHQNPAATPPSPTAAPNTGPFTGAYGVDLGQQTDLDGKPVEGDTPAIETWAVRSVCRPAGCVATASRRSGQTTLEPTLVFDDAGGRWIAVAVGTQTCQNAPLWETFALQPHPDGTLAGEYSAASSNGCASKRTATYTRTGDIDVNSLPDPASQAARVVSPAEALHGRYHDARTFAQGSKNEYDYVVRTDCVRAGDRCMSYFHAPGSGIPMVFSDGNWTWDREIDDKCRAGDPEHVTVTSKFPLPQPPQNPITLLTGHGNQKQTGSCAGSYDFDEKWSRIGD